MISREYIIHHEGQAYTCRFIPGHPGTRLDPPDDAEVEVLAIDGMTTPELFDVDDNLYEALCEERYAAEQCGEEVSEVPYLNGAHVLP